MCSLLSACLLFVIFTDIIVFTVRDHCVHNNISTRGVGILFRYFSDGQAEILCAFNFVTHDSCTAGTAESAY